MLRIIAGKYRHRLIDAPNTSLTRPTTDKVREALMSALGMNIEGAIVLDLFAGSGALGLEALSRGAEKIYFCDNNFLALKSIKKNIENLNIKDEVVIFSTSYRSTLEKLHEQGVVFDLIFLDPPYKKESVYQEVCDYLFEKNMLSEKAIVVKEWNREIPLDERFNSHRSYQYGTIHILIERR